MSASEAPIDAQFPLTPNALPLDALVEGSGDGKRLRSDAYAALVRQALLLYRAGQTSFAPGRLFSLEHDSHVRASKGASWLKKGRCAQCAWHARTSTHAASQLSYQQFYEGLAVDHPVKEKQYIHDILVYDRIGQPIAPPPSSDASSKFVEAVRADAWLSQYQMPPIVTNRDFVELFLTVEFKPHANPLSKEHVEQIIASLDGQNAGAVAETAADEAGDEQKFRSCINIQFPIRTSECEPKKGFVRASYASVESLREVELGKQTEWWMAVQSDSAGSIPLMFQEMAMPSKVAPDVPSFIGWALKQKQ